jgi:hypothetical protein
MWHRNDHRILVVQINKDFIMIMSMCVGSSCVPPPFHPSTEAEGAALISDRVVCGKKSDLKVWLRHDM